MGTSSPSRGPLAPVGLTLWGCGIILVWWTIVLGGLGLVGWCVLMGLRLFLGG